ncbi:MDR family NADP-dependent oxidoreductase [Kitasatospora viridis]|uniref:2-alkenal reductase n=1 Tax=Kitasatospora viridis TaxID=281105 RepID=A0A561T7C8_9ACTN|nr:NADP-dependent oxidoreductase [Kitasatospora viridis]TWF83014.1 2-alkenal reductase [Kitasatospora viridis]
MTARPMANREIRLAARPAGLPGPEHFALVEAPVPDPGPGQVLVRNRWFRLSASLRMMISEGATEVEGVPLPALGPGDVLGGEALGEVLAAPAGSGLRAGQLVRHPLGWREYAAVPVAACLPVGDELPDPVAQLGHGATAYAALTRGLALRRDDTVLVTAASGAIGSMAGQLARLLGAGRVVGTTGSAAKAARLVAEFGFDAAVVRGAAEPLAEQLARAAPAGFDAVLDAAGGEQLAAAVATARTGARIALIGALAGQLAPGGAGRSAPVTLDSFQLLVKKLTLRGYSADDDPDVAAEWPAVFGRWLRDGRIRFPHQRVAGLERAPQALVELMAGQRFGAVIVEL